jgi:hypothetical protein
MEILLSFHWLRHLMLGNTCAKSLLTNLQNSNIQSESEVSQFCSFQKCSQLWLRESDLVRLWLVAITTCCDYDLSWLRLVMITTCCDYDLSRLRLVAITTCRDYDLSLLQLGVITTCRNYNLCPLWLISITTCVN